MKKILLAGLLIMLLLADTVTPVYAGASKIELLPPSEWPVIGPLLHWLGVDEEAPAEVVVTPEPGLLVHHVNTVEDLKVLESLEPGERVRVVATDAAVNAMIGEALKDTEGIQSATVTFGDGTVTSAVEIERTFLNDNGVTLLSPGEDTIYIEGTVRLQASECAVAVTVNTVRVNGWSFGLRRLVQRAVDEQLPSGWPGEVCVEQISVTSGVMIVEGYRR